MTRYLRVSADQIPLGQIALLLFIHNEQLCAGAIEHRCDGRLERRVPDDPSPSDIVLGICRIMADLPDGADLLVVLEPRAYWPSAFPRLHVNQTKYKQS